MLRRLMVHNPEAVAIGSRVLLMGQFVLADLRPGCGEYPKITIGDDCTIMFRFQCNAAQSVRIEENVLIASNVLITDSDHVLEPDGVPITRNGKFITPTRYDRTQLLAGPERRHTQRRQDWAQLHRRGQQRRDP